MIVARLLQRVEAALGYEHRDTPIHAATPTLKLAALALAYAALIAARAPREAAAALAYPLLLHALDPRGATRAAAAAAIPALALLTVALVVNPYPPLTREWLLDAAALAARIYGLAAAGLQTLSTTPPEALASLARRSPLLHDTIILFHRQAPLTVQDLALAYASQRLLGKPPHEPLTGAVLHGLHRASMMEAALTARAAGHRGPRTTTAPRGDPAKGALLLAAAAAGLAATLTIQT